MVSASDADASAAPGLSSDSLQQHDEPSMKAFIGHHLGVILQPFLDDLQTRGAQLDQLMERFTGVDANIAGLRSALDGANGDIRGLRSRVDQHDARLVELNSGLEACGQTGAMMREGLELTNSYVERIQKQVEVTTEIAQDARQRSDDIACSMEALQMNVQRVTDTVSGDVRLQLDQLVSELRALGDAHGGTRSDMDQCRSDLDYRSGVLRDVHQGLGKSNAEAAALRADVDALTSREAQLTAGLQDWRQQWSKLQPAQIALKKEAAVLQQRAEQQEVAISRLQQADAAIYADVEALRAADTNLERDAKFLRDELATADGRLADVRQQLVEQTSFALETRNKLTKTDGDLQKSRAELDTLAAKHGPLSDKVAKIGAAVEDLACEHRKSSADISSLRQDLEGVSKVARSTKSDLEVANTALQGIRGDVVRQNENCLRLERNLETCRSGFTGLQKGFADTSTHVVSRTTALPRIAKDSRTPRGSESFADTAPRFQAGEDAAVLQ